MLSNNPQILNFIKIRSVGGELFHATDKGTEIEDDRHDEVSSQSSQFCERA